MEAFSENSEYHSEKNVYWYEVKPKFQGVSSIVSSIISRMKPESSFVIIAPRDNFYKISARNQSQSDDMNKLMRKGVEGLENANGGGHIPASAALIQREDLAKFKENILR